MTETDPLKRLYRHLRANVTQGVAGDVMQMPPSWGELLTAVHEAAFPDGDEDTTDREAAEAAAFAAGAKAQREADHRFLVSRGTRWAAWLLDGRPLVTDNDDTTTVTSGTEAQARIQYIQYAAGWDAGYSEGHAEGYRDAVERFGADAAERLEADRALAVEVRDRGIAILDDLEAQDLAEAGQCEPRHEQRWKYAYAAHRLRQAKELIIEGDMK